jgi:hypothetical protein
MNHDDLVIPTPEQVRRFKNLGALFGNSEDIFFLRVCSSNTVRGVKLGDILIADRKELCERDELRIYLDRLNERFIICRRDQTFHEYWGKVLWVLKNAK